MGDIKVLVVDDERIDATVMRRALESVGGFAVFEAYSYDEALQAFENEDIELLIADVSLPSKNGIELAKALLRKKPSLKVLFTSGWVGAEVMRASGVPNLERFFLPKPFRVAVFISTVREVLASESLSWPDPPQKNSAVSGVE